MDEEIIHIDLFSGIGGFALAVDEVWDDAEHIFCEIDPYCQTLLKKRFEGSLIYGDIREFTADAYRNRLQEPRPEQQTGGDRQFSEVDILTGGFPCQPFSQAGKRKGTADNRFLWPEMLRVIRDFKPTWVIAENVRGILTIEGGLVFEQVCLDLEGEGYEVQPFVIPAVAVNAPHRRDRVWFVANRNDTGSRTLANGVDGNREKKDEGRQGQPFGGIDGQDSHATDTGCQRQAEQEQQTAGDKQRDWNQNWLEVATELCGVDDGLPAELDGLKLSKSRHRVERLKSLGNAIVPRVAIEIMKAIAQTRKDSLNG